MTPTADTWGVPGPTFLLAYPVLLVAAVLAVRPIRGQIGARRIRGDRVLRPVEAALLRGGDRLAVYAALGQVRAAGLIDDTASPTRSVTTGVVGDPFNAALLDELTDRRVTKQIDAMVTWPGVRAGLAAIRRDLTAQGWLRNRRELRGVRAVELLLWAVVALGAARIVAGARHHRPVGFLVLETLVAIGAVGWVTWRGVIPPTPAARRELRRLRDASPHLDPKLRPSWSAYGPAAAGLSVALWGAGALAAAEPVLAECLVPLGRVGLSSSASSGYAFGGSGGGSSCSGGSSGGSSCSSGSSCGGGGGGCGG